MIESLHYPSLLMYLEPLRSHRDLYAPLPDFDQWMEKELTKEYTRLDLNSLRQAYTNLSDYLSVLKQLSDGSALDKKLLNIEAERVVHALQDQKIVKLLQRLQWLAAIIVIFAIGSSRLSVKWRDNDVLHRACFVYLLLIRACIEQNPGPDTTARVYEIELDDATMSEQLRNKRPEILKGIVSFMEKITQRRCMTYTTLHLYVRSQSEHDVRVYMILCQEYWQDINSDNSQSCTPPEFLAYFGPNQTDILICHKTSANSSGFDLMYRCISQTCSESIRYSRRSDDPFDWLYTQHNASIRLPVQIQYNNCLFKESPRCSAADGEQPPLDVCDLVWIAGHYEVYPYCKYAENMGLLDGCLRAIYIRTEVPRANVLTLSDSLMRRAVDDQTFENITDAMGFHVKIFRRAVQCLANKCNHLPNVYDIVSAIEEINNGDSSDALTFNGDR